MCSYYTMQITLPQRTVCLLLALSLVHLLFVWSDITTRMQGWRPKEDCIWNSVYSHCISTIKAWNVGNPTSCSGTTPLPIRLVETMPLQLLIHKAIQVSHSSATYTGRQSYKTCFWHKLFGYNFCEENLRGIKCTVHLLHLHACYSNEHQY